MPTSKHKRKAAAHVNAKTAKQVGKSGLIAAHLKLFVFIGLCFIAFASYLFAFESQDNSMFGLAMLTLIAGVATVIYANFAVPKKKSSH